MRVFPLLRSGALLDLEHLQSWGCAAFQGCLLQNWCVGVAESLRLVLPCLLCWDNPAAVVGVPLWFLWLQQSCRGTGNLALTPAELVEIRATSSSLNLCTIALFQPREGSKSNPRFDFQGWVAGSPPPITSPPGMPAACALWVGCGVVMWCQQFPVMASLLVTARGKKWVFVDEVVLKFDWDLLSVVVIQCRKCCQWISGEELGARQQEIKSTELLSWSCCIWHYLWGTVECTSLILDDA